MDEDEPHGWGDTTVVGAYPEKTLLGAGAGRIDVARCAALPPLVGCAPPACLSARVR